MKHVLFILFLMVTLNAKTQTTLPITILKSPDVGKPIIIFISGDGGWKGFAPSLAQKLNNKGYPIVGLDARAYFWNRKTPEQTAGDISRLLRQFLNKSKNKNFILMGYSFGADVVPFIQSRLQKELAAALTHSFLLSPSAKTDFEVHILEMIGMNNTYGRSVADEINKLTSPATLIFGSNDTNRLALNKKAANVHIVIVPGNHHFNNDIELIANTIIPIIR